MKNLIILALFMGMGLAVGFYTNNALHCFGFITAFAVWLILTKIIKTGLALLASFVFSILFNVLIYFAMS